MFIPLASFVVVAFLVGLEGKTRMLVLVSIAAVAMMVVFLTIRSKIRRDRRPF
jgi:hypothetical protein